MNEVNNVLVFKDVRPSQTSVVPRNTKLCCLADSRGLGRML